MIIDIRIIIEIRGYFFRKHGALKFPTNSRFSEVSDVGDGGGFLDTQHHVSQTLTQMIVPATRNKDLPYNIESYVLYTHDKLTVSGENV